MWHLKIECVYLMDKNERRETLERERNMVVWPETKQKVSNQIGSFRGNKTKYVFS
jgi:hypothetical protein